MKDLMFKLSKIKRIYALMLAIVVLIAAVPLNMLVYGGDDDDKVSATFTITDVYGNVVKDELTYSYYADGEEPINGLASANEDGTQIVLEDLVKSTNYTIEIQAVEGDGGTGTKFVEKTITFATGEENYTGDIILLAEAADMGANKVYVDIYTLVEEMEQQVDATLTVVLVGKENGQEYTLTAGTGDGSDAKGEWYEVSDVIYNQGDYVLKIDADSGYISVEKEFSFATFESDNPTDIELNAVEMTAKTVDGGFAYEDGFTQIVDMTDDVTVQLPVGVTLGDIDTLGLSFEIDNPDDGTVATVDADGTITLVNAGEAVVKVTKAEDTDNIATTIEYILVVELAEQDELDLNFSGTDENPYEVIYGDSDIQVEVTGGSVENATIKYSSSEESVAIIDSNGKIKIVGAGLTTITATIEATDIYKKVSASFVLKVNTAQYDNADKDFAFSSDEKYVSFVPDAVVENLVVDNTGIVDSTIEYTSSNDAVATIVDGKVVIKGMGVVTITATSDGGVNYEPITCSYTLYVKYTQDITLDGSVFNFIYSSEGIVLETPVISDGDGDGILSYIIKTDENDIAEIDTLTGRLEINGTGTVVVRVVKTEAENSQYESAEIEYTVVVTKALQDEFSFTNPNPNSIKYEDGYTFSNLIDPEKSGSSNEDIIYSVANADDTLDYNIATIDSQTGVVTLTGNGVGAIIVKATKAGGDNYEDISAQYVLVIEKGIQSALTFDETISGVLEKTYGDTYTNVANGGTGVGQITYSSSDSSYITVDNNGKLVFLKSTYGQIDNDEDDKIITITATKSGAGLYEDISVSYQIVVDRALQSTIMFDKNNTSVLLGTEYKNAIVGDLGNGDITYSSNKESVATVAEDGCLTTYKVGTVVITAVKLADECYYGATVSYTIEVKYDSSITSTVFKISGDKNASSNDWFIGNVKITATNGYVLSMSSNVQSDENDADYNWNAVLTENTDFNLAEGTNDVSIYARRLSDGAVSEIIVVEIAKDSENASVTISNVTIDTNGRFNGNVDVTITGTDRISKINSISYVVTNKGVKTDEGIWYADANQVTLSKTLEVIATDNNSDDVVITFSIKDNAGNVITKTHQLKIDIDKPAILVSFDKNTPNKIVENKGYFAESRIATITIVERASNFNAEKATAGIIVKAVKADGTTVNIGNIVGAWEPTEVTQTGETKYVANVSYVANANYTVTISYTDEAGNINTAVDYGTSATPTEFAVDSTKPTGVVSIGALGSWKDILFTSFTFNRWTNLVSNVTVENNDDITPIESVEYFMADGSVPYTENQLLNDVEWTAFDSLSIGTNKKAVVYIKITDYAGNYRIVSSNGVLTDIKNPTLNISVPNVNNNIYNNDVTVTIDVEDIEVSGVMSGIGSVKYEVLNMGNVSQSGTLFEHNKESDVIESTIDKAFVVDKTKNNSNDVIIRVTVVDNAGNQISGSVAIKIDTTAPSIKVTYDNNNGDTTFEGLTLFKENRVAMIEITERNFNANQVIMNITNTDGVQPTVSNWTKVEGTGNGDNTVYRATVSYTADGDYTFDINYTDLASNKATVTDYGNALAPNKFTVDKTVPVINVAYDNTTAVNGNYYNANRVATITITEHNFETSRLVLIMKATDDGKDIQVPNISQWTSNGDVHKATISYTADGYYTFDISYIDMAGNEATDFVEQSFYVDKTEPTLQISGVSDNAAYNVEGNVSITITAKDTNFDQFKPVLTTLVKNDTGYSVKEIELVDSNINNGESYTIDNLAEDGIYNLTCTLIDKAGNVYTKVIMMDKDGKSYEVAKTSEDTLMTFSVNRQGSTYSMDDKTLNIVKDYYVKEISNDISIFEVNADPLTNYVVKLNGKELVEGEDYKVNKPSDGTGSWYKYEYVIYASKFSAEGEYSIIIESTDKAGTTAYSDVKKTDISFVVDKTSPTVTLSGLAESGRYQVLEQTVIAMLTDDGGKVYSFKVVAVGHDGKPLVNATGEDISVRFDKSGEELAAYLQENGGKVTFTIPECVNATIKIYCDDYATGEQSSEPALVFNNVTISQSGMVIFYANQPLFWGTIIGAVCLVVAVIVVIVVMKRRKKNK